VKIDEVAPVWIVLKSIETAINGPVSIHGTQKNSRKSARNLRSRLPQRCLPARAGQQLNREGIPVKVMKFLKRFDQQEIDGKPYWSPPVGVSTEDPGGGFCRFIVHPALHSVYMQDVGVIFMESGDRPYAIRR